MIDLRLGDLALGDVLDQHHHAAVLHRLDGEFERAPVHQVQGEGGIVAAGKPRVEMIDHALRAGLRQQSGLDDGLDHLAHAHALQLEIAREPELLLQLAVRNDDPALGIEHAQAVRHVVDRRVEALGEERHVARGNDGIEQRAAQPVGDEFERQKGGDQQAGEDPVKDVAVEQQRGGHRRPGAEDLHDDKARAAEIAAEDSGRIRNRHREADELRERIGGAREGEIAPQAEQRDRSCRAGDVDVFPAARRFDGLDGRPRAQIGAHHLVRAERRRARLRWRSREGEFRRSSSR